MQHERTVSQRMVRRARRLQAAVQRGGGVGVLAGLLLLPLHVGAVGSGDLDTSFGGDGKVLTSFGSSSGDYANAVAIQADGKIVVAGWSNANGNGDIALARYLPNGTLDASFSGDGKVLTDFGSGSDNGANALALQADGKIVVAGGSNANGNGDIALARYLPNGTLDATFGSNGKVLTDFGSGRSESASAVALQADGKIVVAGASYATASSSNDIALARYLPNGTLDASFSGDGVLTSFSNDIDWGTYAAHGLVLQPDGKIVVAFESFGDFGSYGFLTRYLPNGTVDPSFSGDGITGFGHGYSASPSALALQPNGRIVVAGSSYDYDDYEAGNFTLARYLPNGTLDTTFGSAGTVRTDFGSGSEDYAYALAIQPRDGRLVVAGYSYNPTSPTDFALARYHAIHCNGLVATRVGTAGNDTLMGTEGPDVIVGFDGHDTLYGLGGNDLLCGNTGNDTLSGGSGNDTLVGDTGTDMCDGGSHVSKDTASGCEQVTGVP